MKDAKPLVYFDCSGGVSGDMTLAALLDMGLPFKAWLAELGKLKVRGYRVITSRASRSGIRGTRVRVDAPDERGYRHLSEFKRLIESSRLSVEARQRSLELIRRIFTAEARVHGQRVDKVHLHELGSLDTLVDVVGTVVAMELLGYPDVEASPVNVGGGAVRTEHGLLSVPAPATALLLKGAPIFSDGSELERTTPTGALLVTGFARRFGPWPAMQLDKVGYGVGTRAPKKGRPNVLRVAMGRRFGGAAEVVLVVETTIDDMSPELVGHVMDRLLRAGALDVYVTPVHMKKNRPGVQLTVMTEPAKYRELVEIVFSETTTLGLRVHQVQREVLRRELVTVSTPFGPVRVKLGLYGEKVLNAAPEFEDCRRLAAAKRIALKQVQQAALAAYQEGRAK